MTGTTLNITAQLDYEALATALERLQHVGGNMKLVYKDIGEYLEQSTKARFDAEVDPDGRPWEPLAQATLKRKRANTILQEKGYLKGLIRYKETSDKLLVGSDRVYAAIHQFGGKVDMPARSQQVYFKRNRDGSVGNRFTSKRRSDFAQWASMAAYSIEIPARPFLGLSLADRAKILSILLKHIEQALGGLAASYGRF